MCVVVFLFWHWSNLLQEVLMVLMAILLGQGVDSFLGWEVFIFWGKIHNLVGLWVSIFSLLQVEGLWKCVAGIKENASTEVKAQDMLWLLSKATTHVHQSWTLIDDLFKAMEFVSIIVLFLVLVIATQNAQVLNDSLLSVLSALPPERSWPAHP